GRWDLEFPACAQESLGIFLPMIAIEVNGEKATSLIQKHRVNPHHKRLAFVVLSGKVPTNNFIGDSKEGLVWTIAPFDPRLFADPADPFVGAGRLVAGSASATAFEPQRIDVFATPEQRAE